ncbi:MAG TPA: hypothetical protein VFU15_04465 [Bacteroidia bacterium]|nr:hypothetical protein [Bacteroidia bacterium]
MKKSLFPALLCLSVWLHAQPVLFVYNRCYGGTGNEDRCFDAMEMQPGTLLTVKN